MNNDVYDNHDSNNNNRDDENCGYESLHTELVNSLRGYLSNEGSGEE